MASIFDIPTWQSGTTYSKNDVVRYPSGANKYWYAIEGSAAVVPSLSAAEWGGFRSNSGKDRPHFIWTPSYQTTSNFSPIVKVIKFGDGYEQRVSPNINSNLINLDCRFELRSTQEMRAMLHFLHVRGGVEPFIFDPPDPLNSTKDQFFVCRNWNNSFNFYDNQNLNLKFEQTVAY
jgi:phage-related protein